MKPLTWNGHAINDGTNYSSVLRPGGAGLAQVQAMLAKRSGRQPVVASIDRPGRYQLLDIVVESGGDKGELAGWFDPDDETAKILVVENVDGSNDRYWLGVCEALVDVDGGAINFEALIRIHDDILLREVTASTDTWAILSPSATRNVTNNGKANAYPIIKVKPTSLKASGLTYRRPIHLKWRALQGANRYPTDITGDAYDTAAEISGGFMQADGDDLRVYDFGVEIARWLDGINTTTTKVWCVLDWQPAITGALATAIAATGSISSIDFSATMTAGQFANLPASGAVMIESEVFTYTGKSNYLRQLTGITRAARGTAMAAHSAAVAIYWLQHDLVILMGDSSLTAPTVDDSYKPIINLSTSTNTSWDYDEFGDDSGQRTGAWQFVNATNSGRKYTGNRGANANPWTELGIANNILGTGLSYATWILTNPCYITNANFQNGEKYSASKLSAWQASIRARTYSIIINGMTGIVIDEDTIAAPSTLATWESWSDNEAITALSDQVRLRLLRTQGVPAVDDQFIEVADVTITLNSSYTPVSVIGSRVSIYPLSCRITNNTTGEAIDLEFAMAIDQQLEVDTDGRLVTYLADLSNQFQALELVGGPRKDWLKLEPGVNELQYDETDLVGVTVDLEWEERHYS